MSEPKILAFAGSTRGDSYNKKLIQAAGRIAEQQGAQVTVIDLKDYSLPLYEGDLEERDGVPENARKLYELFKAHEGFLISTPEYNGSFPALLKNTIDWVSRIVDPETQQMVYSGKAIGLLSASPGRLGGLRALNHLRTQFLDIGSKLHGANAAVTEAHNVFDEKGNVNNEIAKGMVEKVVKATIDLI